MNGALLGAVVVNYNSLADVRNCVSSLRKRAGVPSGQIVIVDNASPDGSGAVLVAEYSDCIVVCARENRGYGAGVNIGAAFLSSPYILIVNPDTEFLDDSVWKAVKVMEEGPHIGVLGVNLINADGTPQYSARRFYSWATLFARRTRFGSTPLGRRFNHEHLMKDAWKEDLFETDWVLGTGMIVRSAAFSGIGGMDEKYFLYLEDTDLCARMWQAGWRVCAFGNSRLVHKHRRESESRAFGLAGRRHLQSLLRFRRKFGLPLMGHGKVSCARSASRGASHGYS